MRFVEDPHRSIMAALEFSGSDFYKERKTCQRGGQASIPGAESPGIKDSEVGERGGFND